LQEINGVVKRLAPIWEMAELDELVYESIAIR